MGKLWSIIEDWRDGMDFPPSYRQIALRMGVSQSTFDTWKSPERMPAARNLYAIRLLTNRPFEEIVQAAIDDVQLFSEEQARTEYETYPAREAKRQEDYQAAKQAMQDEADEANEAVVLRIRSEHAAREQERKRKLSVADDTLSPAALDAEQGVDEEPGGSDERD